MYINHISLENKFFIVGGANSKSLSTAELLYEDTNMPYTKCNIPSYPITLKGHSSILTSTGILVCGGKSSSGYQKKCYELRSSPSRKASWETHFSIPSHLTTPRSYFGMIHLGGRIYAIGGYPAKNSMDFFDFQEHSVTRVAIPFSVTNHCITEISDHQFIVTGGYQGGVSKIVRDRKLSLYMNLFPY